MSNLKIRLKRNVLRKQVQIKEVLNRYIQPFKEMPSISEIEQESPDRINAHDLFSLYTADIIKEDIVFVR